MLSVPFEQFKCVYIRRPRQTQGGARQGIRQASLAAPAARVAAVAVAAAAASPALAVRAAAPANEQQPVASSTQAAAAVNIGLDWRFLDF